jgi:hypothetical protein
MRKQLACGIVLALSLATFAFFAARERTEAADEAGPMVVHDVYFALKDNSAEAKKKLVDACKKHLSKHEGEVCFTSGTIADDFNRDINDRDFDVSLHIVFKNKECHDKYQDAARHKQFIGENKDNWKKVRVFDSYATK